MFKAPKIGTNHNRATSLVEEPNLDHAKGLFKPREEALFSWLESLYACDFKKTKTIDELEEQFRAQILTQFPTRELISVLESMLLHRYLMAHANLVYWKFKQNIINYDAYAMRVLKEGRFITTHANDLEILALNRNLLGRYSEDPKFCPRLHKLDMIMQQDVEALDTSFE